MTYLFETMTPRLSLILAVSAVAVPLSAQTTAAPTITSGMDIQVRGAGDTTWTNATTGGITGSERNCVMVKLVPVDVPSGDFILRSFKGFVAVRFKDAHGQWHDVTPTDLQRLQECTPS